MSEESQAILKLGVPKGSLEDATINLFERAGWKIRKHTRNYFPDINDPEITASLCRVQEIGGYIAAGILDVGITGLDSEIKGEKDVDLLMDRYMVDVAGAYHAIQQVLGKEFSEKKGTILVTGGGLALYPMYDYLPLSMDKAALRAMCLALHEELKKQDVFLGTVTVTGVIAPGQPCDPALLAEDFWKLYTDRADCEIVH